MDRIDLRLLPAPQDQRLDQLRATSADGRPQLPMRPTPHERDGRQDSPTPARPHSRAFLALAG
ncbi:hypothetical protein ACWGCC_30390 [Streptomyces nigrescens]